MSDLVKPIRCRLLAGDGAYRYIYVNEPAQEIKAPLLLPTALLLSEENTKPTLVMRRNGFRLYQFLKLDGTTRVYLEAGHEE
jgi:hypothetical protein